MLSAASAPAAKCRCKCGTPIPPGARYQYLPGHRGAPPGKHGGPRIKTPARWIVLHDAKCSLGWWHVVKNGPMTYTQARHELRMLKNKGARKPRLEEKKDAQ